MQIKPLRLLMLAVAAVGGLACNTDLTLPFEGTPGAIVQLVFDGHPADTMFVAVTNATTIAAARQYLTSGNGPTLMTGRIVKGVGFDPRYPYHFIPDSVSLTDVATEVCDAAPMHTAAEVSAFFQLSTGNADAPSAQWCPWSSRPVGVSSDVIIGNAKQ